MKRLDFELPEFTRVSWVSDVAREVWESRIKRVAAAWKALEVVSVARGVRRCGLLFVGVENLLARSTESLALGLVAHPLTISSMPAGYSSQELKWTPDQRPTYRVVVGSLADVQIFKEAFDRSDHGLIGELLGYPSCCRAFFERTWAAMRIFDPTWPMAVATGSVSADTSCLTISATPSSNILWRWLGVRNVPHLPCCFRCEETERLGAAILEAGRGSGFKDEMDWLGEILAWPVEWSALHGIAEVKTPILRISTRTDATATKYVVRLEGRDYPPEGAHGIRFPFRLPEADTGKSEIRLEQGEHSASNEPAHQSLMNFATFPE